MFRAYRRCLQHSDAEYIVGGFCQNCNPRGKPLFPCHEIVHKSFWIAPRFHGIISSIFRPGLHGGIRPIS